jgi:hypothetical protein
LKTACFAAAAVALFGALAPRAHAIVWCHDYTLWEASERRQNENRTPPRGGADPQGRAFTGLREKLTALGYKLHKTLAPFAAGADAEIKPTDVVIFGDAHSGYVNRQKRIDHFVQTMGASGTVRTPEDTMRQPNYRRGATLMDIWSFTREGTHPNGETFRVTPYRGTPVEIWRRTADLNVTITWNTRTDVDLWVFEPDGTKCYFGHLRTRNGGHLLQDVTAGFGPEEFQAHKAVTGEYVVKVHMYSTHTQTPVPTQVTVVVTRNAGTPREERQTYTVNLRARGDLVEVCRIRF